METHEYVVTLFADGIELIDLKEWAHTHEQAAQQAAERFDEGSKRTYAAVVVDSCGELRKKFVLDTVMRYAASPR